MTEQFHGQLKLLPEQFRERVALRWEEYLVALDIVQMHPPEVIEFWHSVCRVWATSEFVAENCIRFPALLSELFTSQDILRVYTPDEYAEKLAEKIKAIKTEEELASLLRRFRRREMLRIVWRDLVGWSNLEGTIKDLSALADACIDQAAQCLYRWQCQTLGTPQAYRGSPQKLIVLGLGKLGGHELNLSSDVDLIFAYPTRGETQGVENPITHEEFFSRLGQRLIQVLNTLSAEGLVFRVDMRLRPLGQSGPLVMPFDALEGYYLEQGRDWERYALIKARMVSGNRIAGVHLMNILRPFVYRRYLDFTMIESLRQMHAMINQEAKSKKLQGNVKLGSGGIREIEFIGQTFQLIRGGQEPGLQGRRILPILKLLGEMKLLSVEAVKELISAYEFLRNTEHRLQAYQDRQTHQLPEDNFAKARLAFAMSYGDWESFAMDLQKHRHLVSIQFQKLVAKPQIDEENEIVATPAKNDLVWLGEEQDALQRLAEIGFVKNQEALRILNELREGRKFQNLSELGGERLNTLMPLLLQACGKTEAPIITLKRLLPLLEGIMRRSAYIVLLLENPKALTQLVNLCAISPWLATLLASYPMLLGEVIDVSRLYAPLNLKTLENNLNQSLASISADDLEQQMECLRRFKLIHLFRVAAMDVTAVLPLMRVSDHLTNIAEVILRQVQKLAWEHLVKRHGLPSGATNVDDFVMIAYGKLGGIELGYGSDLDLVFLYDDSADPSGQQLTDGEHPVSTIVFYTRMAQRMLNMLSARMPSGVLYEVDTRLRPSGESGMLVSSIQTFAHYQRFEAWTWEHQALVRARLITGNEKLNLQFQTIRAEILAKPRDPVKLCKEVREMRQRMREAAKPAPLGQFDLKQGVGGITDIEFLVQYGVLRWSITHPALLIYPDNIRILESIAAEDLLDIPSVRLLSDAYRAYRALVHRFDLENLPSYVPENQFRSYREGVFKLWQQWLNVNLLSIESH